MAEDQIFRAGVGGGQDKDIDVINALTNERSFAEEILIDILRHHLIGIITRHAAAHGGIASLSVARHFLRQPGL